MTDLKSQRLEGNLFKYTNVMRGFQQRYFVVNTIMAKLDYFMNEEAKSQRPRGSIELQNAIISPSEEDSTTFTINTPGNEIFKLRAQDAKERQHWVNVLRLVSQSVDENLKQTTTTNSTNGIHNSATTSAITTTTSTSAAINANTSGTNGFHKSTSLSSGGDVATFNIIPPAMKKFSANNKELESSSFRVTNLELLKEVYNRVKSSNQKLEQLISTLPKKHSRISKYDKDILILKSTAQSCVNHISNCCTVLKNSRHLENETFGSKSLKSSSNYNPTKNSTWSRKSTETSLLASPSSFHALTFNGTNKSSDIATPTRRFPSSSFGQEEPNASELTDPEEHDSITTNANNNTATNNNNSQLDSSRLYEENREIVASTLQNLKTGADLTRVP